MTASSLSPSGLVGGAAFGGSTLVQRLAELVAFDTQNPTGDERPLCEKVAVDLRGLGAAHVETFAVAEHHAVYARFGEGTPRLLLNAHVDTVPANRGYTAPPHTLVERGGRLYGLGAADTKGAVAAILDALAARQAAGAPARAVAVLFSGDEERSCTVARAFLESGRAAGLERAIVCEPTGLAVGRRHRGVGAVDVTATSPGGHSSRADLLPSPVVALSRVALAMDALGKRHLTIGPAGFKGLCMNVASMTGGVAFNVIPSQVVMSLCIRPGPGSDIDALFSEMEVEARRAAGPDELKWEITHAHPPFETRDLAGFLPLLGERARQPIDLAFWTEAALFAARGIDAVVFGPGEIAQAHAADEYVERAQLETARDVFVEVLRVAST